MSRLFDELRHVADPRKQVGGVAQAVSSDRLEQKVSADVGPDQADALPDYRVCAVQLSQNGSAMAFDAPSSQVSEEYRMIRTRILYDKQRVRKVLISSPGPGDGKTTTAFNLASTLALKADNSVLLLEADLRRPSLSPLVGIPVSPGLSNVLNGECTLEEAIVRVEQCRNLCILPAGDASAHPAELLDTPGWRALVDECQKLFNICILDGPPVASVADYILLQNVVDSIVLVARQDHTNRASMRNALTTIPKEKLLGVVLNCVSEWFLWKHPSYAYYAGHKSKK